MRHSRFSLVRLKTRRSHSRQHGRNVAAGKNWLNVCQEITSIFNLYGRVSPNEDIEWIYLICR